jgi:hypothetical protein
VLYILYRSLMAGYLESWVPALLEPRTLIHTLRDWNLLSEDWRIGYIDILSSNPYTLEDSYWLFVSQIGTLRGATSFNMRSDFISPNGNFEKSRLNSEFKRRFRPSTEECLMTKLIRLSGDSRMLYCHYIP